ncbi:MAG: lysozyme [Lachnospiraceae bacterium]|nr:lysozyme [Lachnospiraceae bacterium]
MINIQAAVIRINEIEESEAEDIRKCLTTLYSVREGEQPLDREFGLKQDFLDQPVPIAKNMLALEVIEKTQRYEKRVRVEKVEYGTSEEGQLVPIIYLKKG